MSKELGKTYNPADIEGRLYQKYSDAATKYNRTAPYGPCP